MAEESANLDETLDAKPYEPPKLAGSLNYTARIALAWV
jgi:hypothetical protein